MIRLCALAALVFCISAFSALADENPLHIELVSGVTAIRPGQPFDVALHLQHPAGYHTYWKFPGIVGVPTGIEWNLPKGFTADPIEWPAPQRVMMFTVIAQGFEGECVLPIRIHPPADLAPGGQIELKGKASWMCCGNDCNPGFKDLAISLPVARDGGPLEPWAGRIAAARLAQAAPLQGWKAIATREKDYVTLRLSPISAAAVRQLAQLKQVRFFTEDGLTDPNQGETCKKDAQGFTLRLAISEHAPQPPPQDLIGIVSAPSGFLPDGPLAMSLRLPLQ